MFRNTKSFRVWLDLDFYMFTIFIVIFGQPGSVVEAGSSSFYKEHILRTDQLCPDLQESLTMKDIDTANYPYKSVFRLVDNAPVTTHHDYPCMFESRGPKKQFTTVVVKAIYADKNQWNFSKAEICSEHIKLKFNDGMDDSMRYGLPKIVCKIPKSTASNIAGTALFHPMVWRFPKGKMGLSFSTYHLENNMSNKQNSGSNDTKPRFVQIVFSVYFGRTCSLRVQQYLIDPLKEYCNTSTRFYQLCGAYDCSEEENILSQVGFWSKKTRIEQIEKMLKFVKLRREDPTYMQILISTLRAMIMPILFLVVFYVTRRLRQQKAASEIRRNNITSLRRHTQQPSTSSTSGPAGGNSNPSLALAPSNLAHVIYDIPISNGNTATLPNYKFDDLPPPYESVMPPPSYSEATAHYNLSGNSTGDGSSTEANVKEPGPSNQGSNNNNTTTN